MKGRAAAAVAMLCLVASAAGEDARRAAQSVAPREVSVVPSSGRPLPSSVTFTVAMDHRVATKWASRPQALEESRCEFDVTVEARGVTPAGNLDARMRVGRVRGRFGHGAAKGLDFESGRALPPPPTSGQFAAATALGGLDLGLRLRPDGSARMVYGVDAAIAAAVARPGFAPGDADALRDHATAGAAMKLYAAFAGPVPLPAKLSSGPRAYEVESEISTPALLGAIWVRRRADVMFASAETVRVRTVGTARLLTGDGEAELGDDTNSVKGDWVFSAVDGLPISGRETILLRSGDKDSSMSHTTEVRVTRTSAPPAAAEPPPAVLPELPPQGPPGAPLPWADVVRAMDEAVAAARAAESLRDPDYDEVRALDLAASRSAEAWYRAFAASDWERAGPDVPPDRIRRSLVNAAIQARLAYDAAGEVRFLDAVTSRFPAETADERSALATALVRAGDVPRALACYEALTVDPKRPATVCNAWSRIGEIRAAQGESAAALAAWNKAKAADADAWRLWLGEVAARGERIGAPADELDATTWVGSAAKPLSALRGRVVVLHCFDGAFDEQRKMLLDLDRLARDRGAAGLSVVAAVAPAADRRFRMPPKGATDPRDVAVVEGVPTETWPDLVRQIRANYGLSIPFVVATPAQLAPFGAGRTFVIDRAGRVAFVADATMGATLVATAVDRLLAAK